MADPGPIPAPPPAHPDAERFDRYAARRCRRRKRATVLIIVLAVLVAAWLVVAHSPLTRRMVIPRAEAILNATIEGGDVSIGLDGLVTIRNAAVRVPGVPGTAGIVFEVKRLNFLPAWGRLLGRGAAGGSMLREVELVEPLVRFSQSVDDGSMNIMALDLPSPTGGSSALPRVQVRHGLLELGEHWVDDQGKAHYQALRRIDVDGTVSPSPDFAKGLYQIAVQQIPSADVPPRPDVPRPRLLDLTGTVSEHGVSVTMSGLALDEWHASSVPSRVRRVFEFMNLEGRIKRTRLDLDDREGMRAELELEDVAVNLPIDATEAPMEGPVRPEPPARMRSVNGTVKFLGGSVEADLHGLLEDLPYHVKLNYLALSPDAPFECDFTCENFRIEEKPQILRFAPALVRYRVAQFSNPTGLVSARAHVSRGVPRNGIPGELKVAGTLEFVDVTAAYHTFPYRFDSISGFVRFDDQSLEIVSLHGGAPGGAKISATARISPLTDAAAAHVEVLATGIPLDARLEAAMGPRSRLVSEISSADQYRRLVDRGVLLSPERQRSLTTQLEQARLREVAATSTENKDAAAREIAALEEALRAPLFALRGKGDVSVVIDRKEGDESVWSEIIDVRLGSVGLLPERFPIPILSEGVHVVIDGETVKVQGGNYRGLSGGSATVTATMIYPTIEQPDLDPMPAAHIEARDIPIDDVLVHAVGGAVDRVARARGDQPDDQEGGEFVRRMLGALRLSGTLDATTVLVSDAAGTHVRADARSSNLVARPTRAPDELEISASAATVSVQDSSIDISVQGRVGPDPRTPGADDAGGLSLLAHVDIPERGPAAWTTDVRATALDLSRPVEAAVGVFSAEAADRIADVRHNDRPAGRADVHAELSGAGGPFTGEVTLTALHAATLSAFGGRVTLDSDSGAIRMALTSNDEPQPVRFDSFAGACAFDAEPVGRVTLDGAVTRLGTPQATGTVRVGLEGARFESALVRKFAQERAGAGLRDLVEHTHPEGLFDATLSLASDPRTPDAGLELSRGLLRPRNLAVTLDAGRVEWPRLEGEIEFESGSGAFRNLRGDSSTGPDGSSWSFQAGGSWVIPAPGAIAVQSDLSLRTRALPQSLLAVLPSELTDVLAELTFNAGDGIVVPRTTVRYNDDGTSAGRSVRVDGRVELDGASLQAGVPVTECRGSLDFSVDHPAGAPTKYELWATLPGFRLAGLAMTDGKLRLSGGGDSAAALVPMVSADCYGGRLAGAMSVRPTEQDKRRYQAELKLSGVRFAPVLRDLGVSTAEKPAPLPPGTPDPVAIDESRGRLDAQISLGGIVGDDASRRGRGSGVVGNGSVIQLPLLLPLIQFSNLQLPTDERLRLATGDFYLHGPSVVFENLSVFSDNVRIFGYGTASWPGMDLDLRFNSRAVRRVPVISGMLESLRDELVSISVTGNIKKPEIATVPLSGTGQLLERMFGSPSEQDRLMREIERRAMRDLDRVRTTGARASDPSPISAVPGT